MHISARRFPLLLWCLSPVVSFIIRAYYDVVGLVRCPCSGRSVVF